MIVECLNDPGPQELGSSHAKDLRDFCEEHNRAIDRARAIKYAGRPKRKRYSVAPPVRSKGGKKW